MKTFSTALNAIMLLDQKYKIIITDLDNKNQQLMLEIIWSMYHKTHKETRLKIKIKNEFWSNEKCIYIFFIQRY